MRKVALAVTTALVFTLTAARLHAEKAGAGGADRVGSAAGGSAHASTERATDAHGTSNRSGARASDTGVDGWRYRWHNARWWYWTTEGKWVVWSGTTWVPCEQSYGQAEANAGVSVVRDVTTYGSYERQDSAALSRPAYRGSASRGRPGAPGGGDYALYGWTWGPGTAYRDGPPRRF